MASAGGGKGTRKSVQQGGAAAGASIGPHTHQGEFEAFYVLSGTATVTDGDRVEELHEGDMNLCVDGGLHGVENRGESDLALLALIMNTL